MTKLDDIKDAMINSGDDVYFDYNGKHCGIESTVDDGKFTFEAWYGETDYTYDDVNKVLTDRIFGGKSFEELMTTVDFWF